MPQGISSAHSEKEKRIKFLLSFAEDLQSQISNLTVQRVSRKLLKEIEKQIAQFPNNIGSLSASKCAEVDSVATALWNLCTRTRRSVEDVYDGEINQLEILKGTLLVAKVFSFLLLDCTRYHDKPSTSDIARLMKTALRTAKTMIDNERYELATKVMEKASIYEQIIKNPNKHLTPEDEEKYSQTIPEYYILRTALAWRQDKFDIAEHMYHKVEAFDPSATENLADTLYEMGKDLLKRKQYDMAVKWLDRASEMIASQELDKMSFEAFELRTSILQSTVDALLKLQSHEGMERARDIVALLSSEVGDKLVVLLLKLEILNSVLNESFDSNAYHDVLQRIMESVTLSKDNFKLIMSHIRKLHDKSPSLACKALYDFLDRILEEDNIDWTERVVITRILMATSQQTDEVKLLEALHDVLERVSSCTRTPFRTTAIHAAHMLLWKRIEMTMIESKYETAQIWCQLALHPLFAGAGEINVCKITRKLLMCAIARKDPVSAHEVFSSMPKEAQDSPLTRFLMFKFAIRSHETALASQCLEKLYDHAESDSSILYACVMDAQQFGETTQIISALQLVLQKSEFKPHEDVHMPSLLRCTLRLMFSQLESQQKSIDSSTTVDEICRLFEAAIQQAERSLSVPAGPKQFTLDELTWFAKNSYHMAIKYSSEWEAHHVLRMTKCCKTLITMIPRDANKIMNADLIIRLMSCDFLAALLLIALARAEDNIEVQLDNYLELRRYADDYDTKLQEKLAELEEVVAQDLLGKLGVILAWDFEAAIHLKQWDSLREIVMKADSCKSLRTYEMMADCILSSEATPLVKIATLKIVVNEVWSIDTIDTKKLSRYLRILFQLSLDTKDSVAEELLDQVASLAHDAGEGAQSYPLEELEWIATTAFNKAVDFFVTEDDQSCRRWAEKALNVAACCMDDGRLQNILQEKFVGLKFDS